MKPNVRRVTPERLHRLRWGSSTRSPGCPSSSRPRTRRRRRCRATRCRRPTDPQHRRAGHGRLGDLGRRRSPPRSTTSCRFRSAVLKQIRTPAYVGPNTLAFAMSYSGDTEETVSMARSAARAGRAARRGLVRRRARSARARCRRAAHAVPVGLSAASCSRRAGRAAVHRAVPPRSRAGRARAC